MSEEETPAKRGDAAWKEQRDAIARRNADAHQRSQGERTAKASYAATTQRADAVREADQLRKLNDKLAKQQAKRSR